MKKINLIVKEKILFEGKTFEILNRHFKGNRVIEIARRSPGVRLIIIKYKKMLLTKEFRYELDKYDYRLPGGKVFDTLKEYRQAIRKKANILKCAREAAKKECLEETGLILKKIKLFQISKAGLTVDWDLFYFIVDDFVLSKQGQKLEHGEIIHPEWKTFDEVKELCLNNKVTEDISVGILLKFLLNSNK